MKAESSQIKHLSYLEEHIIDCFKRGFKPTLGIIFCSPSVDFEHISHIFDCFNIELFGCTSAGEITNDDLTQNTISCLLLEIPKEQFAIGFERNIDGVFNAARKVRLYGQSYFDNPSYIICASGIGTDGDKVLEGFKHDSDKDISIFGGLAGGSATSSKTHVFTRYIQSDNGIASIIFDSDYIEVAGLATSGWQALGAFNTVTKSADNIIYTINNEPALDFLKQVMHQSSIEQLESENVVVAHEYPFQVLKENKNEVIRVPIISAENKENNSLTLSGSIKDGEQFRFSVSPSVDVVNQTVKEFEALNNLVPDAEALILFSCIGRYSAFGPFLDDEIKGIYNYWKKPMIGFLTYGEFGNMKNGISEFHNETCSLVTIRKKVTL